MPNYSLQVNNSFKPFTMQEMLTPFLLYKDYYEKNEQAVNDLTAQANTVEAMIQKERDPIAASRYQQYADNLRQQAEELSTSGMSIGLRNAINQSKGDYVSQIVPIQKAYETMMKHIDEQRKMGDSRINSYDADKISLDRYLENPELSYESIDADKLYKTSFTEFSTLQNELREYSLAKDRNIKDNYYKLFKQKYGVSPEDATQFMNEVRQGLDAGLPIDEITASNPVMNSIFKKIYNSTMVDNWDNPDASRRTAEVILNGAVGAIGKESLQLVSDKLAEAELDYQYYKKKKALDEKPVTHDTSIINPLPLRNVQEISENNKEINKYLEKGYIKINEDTGKIELTKKGQNSLYKANRRVEQPKQTTSGNVYLPNGTSTTAGAAIFVSNANPSQWYYEQEATDFGKFMEGIYGEPLATMDKNTGKLTYTKNKDASTNDLNAVMNQLYNINDDSNSVLTFDNTKLNDYIDYNKKDSYDTYHTTEFDTQYNSTEGKERLAQENVAAGGKFTEVEWDGGKWKKVGTLNYDDLGDGAYVSNDRTFINPRTGKDESTIIIQDKDGNLHRVLKTPGINVTNEYNKGVAFMYADIYRRILESGKQPKMKKDIYGNEQLDLTNGLQFTDEPLTLDDIAAFQDLMDDTYLTAYMYNAKIKQNTQTEDHKYK